MNRDDLWTPYISSAGLFILLIVVICLSIKDEEKKMAERDQFQSIKDVIEKNRAILKVKSREHTDLTARTKELGREIDSIIKKLNLLLNLDSCVTQLLEFQDINMDDISGVLKSCLDEKIMDDLDAARFEIKEMNRMCGNHDEE